MSAASCAIENSLSLYEKVGFSQGTTLAFSLRNENFSWDKTEKSHFHLAKMKMRVTLSSQGELN